MVVWVQHTPRPSAGDAVVRDHEDALRVDLPRDFVAVAQHYQGASPVPGKVTLPNGFVTAVSHLLHFDDGFGNIVTRGFPLQGVLEKGVIPFAEDIGGDVYCFSFRDDYDHPPVVFWSVDWGALTLAPSFTAFVAALHE